MTFAGIATRPPPSRNDGRRRGHLTSQLPDSHRTDRRPASLVRKSRYPAGSVVRIDQPGRSPRGAGMGEDASRLDRRSIRPASDDPALSNLDAGERSAIALAQSETNALLLIDEAAGRREASRRGISNTGTLGILRAAALGELIDLPSALGRLLASNFR